MTAPGRPNGSFPPPRARATHLGALCPLCGSPEGRILIQTDAIYFVECPSCAGIDQRFWVTRTAGARAEWMRRTGHTIDPQRARGLVGARRDRSGSALLRAPDVDEIVEHDS